MNIRYPVIEGFHGYETMGYFHNEVGPQEKYLRLSPDWFLAGASVGCISYED